MISGATIKSEAINSIFIKEYNKIKGYEKVVVVMPDSTNRCITSEEFLNEINLPSKITTAPSKKTYIKGESLELEGGAITVMNIKLRKKVLHMYILMR